MKKVGIIFGSSTGTCENIANTIARKLGMSAEDVMNAGEITVDKVNEYEVLLLGTSTWGYGELQDDWCDGINVLKSTDLKGKTIALFGCGDSESYSDTFCDAIGLLYQDLKDSGCSIVGKVSPAGYHFSSSIAVVDGMFVGLALDDVNEDDKTEGRIDAWLEEIKTYL